MATTRQPGDWQHSLFSCCESMSDTLIAWLCGPCYNFMATRAAGESTGCAILTCILPITMCCVRGNVREKRGIQGSAVGDLLTIWCCHCCSSIQIKREFD